MDQNLTIKETTIDISELNNGIFVGVGAYLLSLILNVKQEKLYFLLLGQNAHP